MPPQGRAEPDPHWHSTPRAGTRGAGPGEQQAWGGEDGHWGVPSPVSRRWAPGIRGLRGRHGTPRAPQRDWKILARGGRDRSDAQAQERSCGEAVGPSRPYKLLDHVAGEAVEEEGQHEQPQQCQHDLDDEPLVPRADEVLDGLEGVEEPDEGGVGPAGGGELRSGSEHLPGHLIPSPLLDPKRPRHGPNPQSSECWSQGVSPLLSVRFAAFVPCPVCRTPASRSPPEA